MENKKKDPSTEAHYVRSRVLNYAIIIEMQLGDFIREYFINDEPKKIKFNELILNKEFFTFEQKIRIFGKIIKEMKDLEIFVLGKGGYNLGDNTKELMERIRYIQEIRNAIAHEHPFRNKGTDEISIKYKFGGKIKEIILNESFGMEFFKGYSEIYDILRSLSKELFKK